MIDTEKMRENFADRPRRRILRDYSMTHYEGCEYVHPLCAIEALCREVERLRGTVDQLNRALSQKSSDLGVANDPSWLPAPDTMPSDLAPAQMVEVRRSGGGQAFGKMIAIEVCWLRWDEYRPLYSDSGHALCSAEGLEEWAQYVVTPESGNPAQCPKKPELGVKFWIAAGWSYAPQTHRKPGDWRESLMEVTRR